MILQQNLYNVKVPAFVILFNFSTRKEEKMEKYLLSDEQLQKLMEKTIDLFLEYQYKRGYEEPLARSRAVMDVIGQLRHIKGPPPFRSE